MFLALITGLSVCRAQIRATLAVTSKMARTV